MRQGAELLGYGEHQVLQVFKNTPPSGLYCSLSYRRPFIDIKDSTRCSKRNVSFDNDKALVTKNRQA